MSGILTIDLSAIQSNWKQVGAGLAPGVENTAVIKANAYGLGVEPVAQALYAVGCRTFFVATLLEAQQLRSFVNSEARIFILTGLRPGEEHRCIVDGFVPVLVSLEQIKCWEKACVSAGVKAASAIKVDTGMHRLGLSEPELAELCLNPKLLLSCSPVLLMSHLACADSQNHPLNLQQLQTFKRCAEQVRAVVPSISLSLANSSGVCLGPEYHFDLVRPGACLYGVNPTPEQVNPMTAVVNLRLPILQIKTVSGPASLGYDATYSIAAGDTKTIAVAAGGYGDGLFVHLSNKGFGMLAGHRVPMVGRVSMDSTLFDISAVDQSQLIQLKNPHIEMLNAQQGVDDVARAATTIGYEVLTSLGHRYQRRYLD